MIKETTVKLKIWYDDQFSEHPGNWNWNELLDLGSGRVCDDCEGVILLEVDDKSLESNNDED